MNNMDRLNLLKMIYGPNVVCTNGLFHIIDDNHKEMYISNINNELDKRTQYETILVTDKSILAIDLNSSEEPLLGVSTIQNTISRTDKTLDTSKRKILLDKNTLEYKYITNNNIKYIINDIYLISNSKDSCIIDNNGKTRIELKNCNNIVDIGNNLYICESDTLFSDKLVIIKDKDRILDITKDRRYRLKSINKDKIRIDLRSGGAFILDLRTKQCLNTFTNKIESSISFFDTIL